MKFHFTIVSAPHPHTQMGRLAKTPSGSFCWDKEDPNPSQYAVLATNRKILVGIQKFDVVTEDGVNVLESGATYVWPMYRELKVAQRMWAHALKTLEISKANVYVVSDRGKTLVESLRELFPDVTFELKEGGGRTLRALKGRGKGKYRQAA